MNQHTHWDEIYRSGDYSSHWGIPYPSQELVAFVATNDFPENTVALDVGCGAGQESIFLAQQGFKVTGVDQSTEGLKIAQQQALQAGVQIDWHEANVLHLPLADHSVNVINDRGCFHVIPDDSRAQYAHEMARVLTHGGKILLRGCRDTNNERFTTVDAVAIDHYFATHFTRSPVLPIEIITGQADVQLPANLVVLTRR